MYYLVCSVGADGTFTFVSVTRKGGGEADMTQNVARD